MEITIKMSREEKEAFELAENETIQNATIKSTLGVAVEVKVLPDLSCIMSVDFPGGFVEDLYANYDFVEFGKKFLKFILNEPAGMGIMKWFRSIQ